MNFTKRFLCLALISAIICSCSIMLSAQQESTSNDEAAAAESQKMHELLEAINKNQMYGDITPDIISELIRKGDLTGKPDDYKDISGSVTKDAFDFKGKYGSQTSSSTPSSVETMNVKGASMDKAMGAAPLSAGATANAQSEPVNKFITDSDTEELQKAIEKFKEIRNNVEYDKDLEPFLKDLDMIGQIFQPTESVEGEISEEVLRLLAKLRLIKQEEINRFKNCFIYNGQVVKKTTTIVPEPIPEKPIKGRPGQSLFGDLDLSIQNLNNESPKGEGNESMKTGITLVPRNALLKSADGNWNTIKYFVPVIPEITPFKVVGDTFKKTLDIVRTEIVKDMPSLQQELGDPIADVEKTVPAADVTGTDNIQNQ